MPTTGLPFLASLLLTFSLASASAQSLAERDRCYRAKVTALFEGSVWMSSSNAGIISKAFFLPEGEYRIEAYQGAPIGSPVMEFDGTWAFIGENVISVDMLGTESSYVVADDMSAIMNKMEVLFELAEGDEATFAARSLDRIQEDCGRDLLAGVGFGPVWTGLYEGIQPAYDMRNEQGEVIRISGKTIGIPAVRHIITLGKEGAIMTQTTLDAQDKTYSYSGTYAEKQVGADGLHGFQIEFTDGSGSSPTLALAQIDADHFKVYPGRNGGPDFIVERNPPSMAAVPVEEEPEILFYREVRAEKKNVNVRATPPSGEVVTTVDGGKLFAVHEVLELSDPIHLLAGKADLNRVDEQGTIHKSANHKLEDVKDAGAVYFAIVYDDEGHRVRVIIPKELVQVRRDAWFRSDDLGGWIFSGLCIELEGCSH